MAKGGVCENIVLSTYRIQSVRQIYILDFLSSEANRFQTVAICHIYLDTLCHFRGV